MLATGIQLSLMLWQSVLLDWGLLPTGLRVVVFQAFRPLQKHQCQLSVLTVYQQNVPPLACVRSYKKFMMM